MPSTISTMENLHPFCPCTISNSVFHWWFIFGVFSDVTKYQENDRIITHRYCKLVAKSHGHSSSNCTDVMQEWQQCVWGWGQGWTGARVESPSLASVDRNLSFGTIGGMRCGFAHFLCRSSKVNVVHVNATCLSTVRPLSPDEWICEWLEITWAGVIQWETIGTVSQQPRNTGPSSNNV